MTEPEIYLFTGPEAGDKNEAIATIKADAKKRNGEMDIYSYYAADVRVEDVIAKLQNKGLFSSATFITLRNAEQIKTKAEIELISSWAKSAVNSPDTLILVSDENSVDKKLEAAVPSSHKKIFWEMFDNRKPQWVKDYFRKNGFGVTDEAVDSILEMIENNTECLKSECSRFFYCFEKGHEVNQGDVEKILSHNREENAFTLFACLSDSSLSQKKRFENSVEILQKIRLSKESNSVALISGLTYCFRTLRSWHLLHANGKNPSDAELRQNGISGKTNQKRYENAAKIYSPGVTSSIISLLASTDMSIREGGTTMEDTMLTMLLYSIVMKNGRYCSQYESC